MRYSITGISPRVVEAKGVSPLKKLPRTGVMFAELTQQQVSELKALGATVELIQTVKTEISVPKPRAGARTYTPQAIIEMAGIDDFSRLTRPPLSGRGVNIAIIDTGVRETHELVNGRVALSKNYTGDEMEDGFNHGTGIASIVAAVAPECNILNLKVMDSKGDGTTEEVIEAIEDCIELWYSEPWIAPVIINMSFGAEDTGNPNDPLRVACRAALENRIWLFAAAGNAGPEGGTITSPAVERYVLAVGSVNPSTLEVSSFSSRGPTGEGIDKPDVAFFGEAIQVASSEGDARVIGRSGTSYSSSFVSGVGALYLQGASVYGNTRPMQDGSGDHEVAVSLQQIIDDKLVAMCAKPEGVELGKDDSYGYGIPVGDLMAQSVTGMRQPVNALTATTLGQAFVVSALVTRFSVLMQEFSVMRRL